MITEEWKHFLHPTVLVQVIKTGSKNICANHGNQPLINLITQLITGKIIHIILYPFIKVCRVERGAWTHH